MKKLLRTVINKLGYDIKKIDKEFVNNSLEKLLIQKINNSPIIFDVGGNKGQSIEIFQRIFKKPFIHSFEPILSEFNFMKQKFQDNKNLILNNYALGKTEGKKKLYVLGQTGASSFNKLNKNSRWAQVRSREYSTTINEFITSEKVKISTLDKYCLNKKIDKIDLLKIDTQGYEDKVLQGSMGALKKNKIKAVVTEIMFDNVYDKYFSFSDIEKFLLPYNFRMVGIYLSSNSLFGNLTFFADVFYLNKSYYDL